jgi:hypothetical protein
MYILAIIAGIVLIGTSRHDIFHTRGAIDD